MSKIAKLIGGDTEFLKERGPKHHIVASSRVRLARNLADVPFPGWAKKQDRVKVLETILPVLQKLPQMKEGWVESLENLSVLEKHVLVERHLISREHAAKNVGSAVVINRDQSLSIMVNEEDHLRIQSLHSGLGLRDVYKIIDEVDSRISDQVPLAYSSKFGFLTACPTNVGTGMRASVMLHLPGLVLSEQINQIIQAVNKLSLAVRGLYGEGTEASGNLFQVSNQTTLGEKEGDILERFEKVINTIIEHEENARLKLLETKPHMVADQVGRAYGVLTSAFVLNSREAMNLLSMMILGVDLGFFPKLTRSAVDRLFIETQPSHLQSRQNQKMTAEERDELRGTLIREAFLKLDRPKIKHELLTRSEKGKS
jgi:protein arginine kinase